jgi:hypothetical protein
MSGAEAKTFLLTQEVERETNSIYVDYESILFVLTVLIAGRFQSPKKISLAQCDDRIPG